MYPSLIFSPFICVYAIGRKIAYSYTFSLNQAHSKSLECCCPNALLMTLIHYDCFYDPRSICEGNILSFLFSFTGDGRVKMPLSPTVHGSQQTPFGLGHSLGSSIQLTESSLYPSTSSVSHSYSSSSLGQMQFDNSSVGSFWSPHRSQMRLQSRRSQSREDLNSSIAETQMVKV